MASEEDRVKELELEVQRLMHEVDKYRSATEDTLQQLDWCIGYFTGCNKSTIAKSLSANRSYIRRHLLDRADVGMPSPSS